jgi:predicted O-linked N-acetylglucosamine transferase (SPINDLY family)
LPQPSKPNIQDAARLHQQGKLDEAEKLYRALLKDDPRNFDASHLLGLVFLNRGKAAEAIAQISAALSINETVADAHMNLAFAYRAANQPLKALESFDKTIALQPDNAQAHFYRGNVLHQLGRTVKALEAFDRCLALQPQHAEAWNNRGILLQNLNRPAEAVESLKKAVDLKPDYAEGYNNLGNALLIQKNFEAAVSALDKAMDLDPRYPCLQGTRLFNRMLLCDWRDYDENIVYLDASILRGEAASTPFSLVGLSSSAAAQKACAERFVATTYPPRPPLWTGEKYNHDKIRIAYLSADFHEHATAYLMAGLFEAHDRDKFDISAYSFGPATDGPMRRRLEKAFGANFVDVRGMDELSLAKLLREKETDIAVDLKGFTEGARTRVFSHRPAPVQVNFIGYPGTMGASYIDYIIADDTIIPQESERFYTEKIIRLPDTYQPNDSKRNVAASTPPRCVHGLPDEGFVFCCFNINYKITPPLFDIWMNLLEQVPGSVLWLLDGGATATRNLRSEAERRGIDPTRLVFAPRMKAEEHLARHRHADLFLDTLPYNAHTTTADALWMGLPVITCPGETFASRVAASLLKAAGLPELVTRNLQDYARLARDLAHDPTRLKALRNKLENNRDTCALFDTARYKRNLEAAYVMMHVGKAEKTPEELFADGLAQTKAGHPLAAISSYSEALKCKPDYVQALVNRGNVLAALGRTAETLEDFRRALALRPDVPELIANEANTLRQLGRAAEALQSYGKALQLRPDLQGALVNRGSLLHDLRRLDEALADCDAVLALRPDFAEVRLNRAHILRDKGLHVEALEEATRAAAQKPGYAEAEATRGGILRLLKRHAEAAQAFAVALKYNPELALLRGLHLHSKMTICDWTCYDDLVTQMRAGIAAGKCRIGPFPLLALPSTPAEQLACARDYTEQKHPARPALWKGERYSGDKIRIAYLSADFHEHATAYLMAGLFEAHDRNKFHITALSFGNDDKSPMRARLQKSFDEFRDVRGMNDDEAARLLFDARTEITIDLKGYTQDARTGILARRPCPVQVNYLGFPGTMGAPYIDYIIADGTLITAQDEKFYSEKIVRLPGSYQPNDDKREIAPALPTRAALGLPVDGFVFCCFNNSYKITPDIFAVWMRLLAKVPGSVLWLLGSGPEMKANLTQEAQRHGIAQTRLVFAPRLPSAQHLARHRLADLFLDTLPYNAHTTAADALWTGLPLVTCAGDTFASRVAASLLTAADMPELITRSLAEYENLALALAQDKPRLDALRKKLATARDTCPLFDTAAYARHLESAYEHIAKRAREGLIPQHFNVK